MDLRTHLPPVTTVQALAGMRRPFLRSFGRGFVGRRLARAAWSAFQAALLHGSGLQHAASHAQVAAEDENVRTMVVAQWSRRRIAHVVSRAATAAADAP